MDNIKQIIKDYLYRFRYAYDILRYRELDITAINELIHKLNSINYLSLDRSSLINELLICCSNLPITDENHINNTHPSFIDSPLTLKEAVHQASILRVINDRVKSEYYKDKLIVIATLEKSGSTVMEICVREMLTRTAGIIHDIGIQKTLQYGPFSFVDALYPKVLLYVHSGGVLRSVIRPLPYNIDVLNIWKCRYLILFRHPADRLVGRYCDPTPPNINMDDGVIWSRDPQYLMSDIFASGRSMESVFEELICGGYLIDTLKWMADWLRVRDKNRSNIIRYEDMREDENVFFSELHEFLFDNEITQELRDALNAYTSDYKEKYQPGDKQGRRYTKGYSGEIGIWRSYFTENNIIDYRKIVNNFLNIYPHAKQLLDYYPDLIV